MRQTNSSFAVPPNKFATMGAYAPKKNRKQWWRLKLSPYMHWISHDLVKKVKDIYLLRNLCNSSLNSIWLVIFRNVQNLGYHLLSANILIKKYILPYLHINWVCPAIWDVTFDAISLETLCCEYINCIILINVLSVPVDVAILEINKFNFRGLL